MTQDEHAIRHLVEEWARATEENNPARVMALISDDAVFLTPGNPPLYADGFETALKSLGSFRSAIRMHVESEIQDIQIAGDMAYCWNRLVVTITQIQGSHPPNRRTGDSLSVLRKQPDGSWLLAIDANLLTGAIGHVQS